MNMFVQKCGPVRISLRHMAATFLLSLETVASEFVSLHKEKCNIFILMPS